MLLFDLTLEKNLFFELDPEKNEKVVERELARYGERVARTLEFNFKKHPEIKSITAQKRHYAYYDKCYIHLGEDLEEPVSLRDQTTKECILEVYMEIAPEYLKKDMDFEDENIDLLQYFDLSKMPDPDRPKYAFPGLVTFEDRKAGRVKEKDSPSFPGLRVFSEEEKKSFLFPWIRDASEREKPAYSTVEGYSQIKGESVEERNENLLDQLEQLKKQFQV